MTVSRNDIQQLLAEVDQLLGTVETPAAQETAPQQQEVLEKVRWCLSNLARQVEVPGGELQPLAAPEQQTAQAIAQAVMAQMNGQRQDWLQPLQLELEALRQQRETLHREIRHLESHQRQMSHELLQTVMHRCSESLKQELSTVFERLQGQFTATLAGNLPSTSAPPALQQLDWLEKLRSLEQQADQLFLSLDQTFHQVFASLEQDVQGYHQSLQQKLGQIHELQQLQQQTLLAATSPMTAALPQPADVTANATAVGQMPPTTAMPLLELDTGEPLPILEPLLPNELALPTEPMGTGAIEQVLHLDLPPQNDAQPFYPASQRTDPHAVSGDQAWEAWDEYLFSRDPGQEQSLITADAPRVLTVDLSNPSPQAPAPPQQREQSPAESPQLLSDITTVPDLPRAMQQELFANLGDPAQIAADPEPMVAGDAAADDTSPVGTVLFGDPVAVPETAIAAEEITAALDPDAEAETVDPQGPSLEETIASLDDLLEQVSARMTETPIEAADTDADAVTIPAGETLLTTDEVSAQMPSGQLDAVLDAQRMQQLSTDLANFEETHLEGANLERGTVQEPSPPESPQPSASVVTPAANTAPMSPMENQTPAQVNPPQAHRLDAASAAMSPVENQTPAQVNPPQAHRLHAASVAPTAPTAPPQPQPTSTPPEPATASSPMSTQSSSQSPSTPATPNDAVDRTLEQDIPEQDIPEQMVLSALSDLGWDALIDEASLAGSDANADLWGEQPQRSTATTAVGSSDSSPS
ncbi:MAG: hypothetical protein AAGG51_22700 [Cyanobacteria bacterium P01_G01_bin.54]